MLHVRSSIIAVPEAKQARRMPAFFNQGYHFCHKKWISGAHPVQNCFFPYVGCRFRPQGKASG
jgi:hypothetical protein